MLLSDAVDDDRPRQPLLPRELLRHGDDEHADVTAREKVRRLAQVRTAGLDAIVRADRHVDGLRAIAIQIADEER